MAKSHQAAAGAADEEDGRASIAAWHAKGRKILRRCGGNADEM